MNDFISIKALKKRTLDTYQGNWMAAIKANILPIISAAFTSFMIMTFIGIAVVVFTQTDPAALRQATNYDQAASVNSAYSGTGMARDFLSMAIATFFMVGIQYGTLDWLRNRTQIPSWGAPFQTFTRKYFTSTLAIFLFEFIFLTLWSFLFVIPAIIKFYSYSQSYLLYKDAQERQLTDQFEFVTFITFSRRLMNGYKARFLLLQLSLLGWFILSVLTFGIGFLWYIPYRNGVYTAFYEDLVEKRGKQVVPEIFA
ncbi:DUF975 family protein [Pediococcus acidilactici]